MNPPTNNEVPCNGPCRKRFRPDAVSMDQVTANVLLSSGRTPGLTWLCPECHLHSTASNHPSETDLPPELWIMVFRHLDTRSKIRVRSTCRRWKTIVDQNKSLREEFCIGFKEKTLNGEFHPENLFPAAHFFLYMTSISSIDGWWPSFGAGLTELYLSDCEISFRTSLGMLRETPNLRRLSLSCIKFTSAEATEADFRLEKLEYLSCDEVFDIYEYIFPRLRKLELSCELEDEASACRLIQSVQETLKELDCLLTPFMLKQIASMGRLCLTNAEVPLAEKEVVVQLSQVKPMIEKLHTTATNETLCKIGRNLAKLKEITIALEEVETVVLTFLAEMPQLTLLHLEGMEETVLNLTSFRSAKLINMKLESLCFAAGSLRRFLEHCPILRMLEINESSLDSWSDIFEARLGSLRGLKLWNVKVAQNVMNVPQKLNFLNELKLSWCNISRNMLVELLLQCPRLEKLTLNQMDTVDDEFLRTLGWFPQLKELSVHGCAITSKSLELIAEKHSYLKVDIRSEQIPYVALKLLKHVTRS